MRSPFRMHWWPGSSAVTPHGVYKMGGTWGHHQNGKIEYSTCAWQFPNNGTDSKMYSNALPLILNAQGQTTALSFMFGDGWRYSSNSPRLPWMHARHAGSSAMLQTNVEFCHKHWWRPGRWCYPCRRGSNLYRRFQKADLFCGNNVWPLAYIYILWYCRGVVPRDKNLEFRTL